MYLTAILRDYLRAFAKNTYAIGNALFEKDGEENNCFSIRAVSSAEEGQADGALEDWRKMVNDVADLFDKAADLCSAAWDHRRAGGWRTALERVQKDTRRRFRRIETDISRFGRLKGDCMDKYSELYAFLYRSAKRINIGIRKYAAHCQG